MLQIFVKNYTEDSKQLRYIRELTISVVVLNEFYCMSELNVTSIFSIWRVVDTVNTDLTCKTCYNTFKMNCIVPCKKQTAPLTEQSVPFTKQPVPFLKRTVLCKNRATIIYARPPQNNNKKRTIPCNKRTTSMYDLIDQGRLITWFL